MSLLLLFFYGLVCERHLELALPRTIGREFVEAGQVYHILSIVEHDRADLAWLASDLEGDTGRSGVDASNGDVC